MTRDELREELKKQGYILVLWHEDDIKIIIEKFKYSYDENDIKNISNNIEVHFDAQVGVCWDIIEQYVDEHFFHKHGRFV